VTLERRLARLFTLGTWTGSATIALGLWLSRPGVMNLGIAMFLALPVVRVFLMLGAYLRARDYRIAAVALLVLVILAAGLAIGLLGPAAPM
jgi:uncharacterized membrane protein